MLLRAGFDPARAVLAVDLVFDLAADNRRGVEDLDRITGTGASTAAGTGATTAVRQEIEAQWRTVPLDGADGPTRDERRQVRSAMTDAIRREPVEWFRDKLRVVLTGIEHELAPPHDAADAAPHDAADAAATTRRDPR
jgi:hypothetical protein